MKLSVIIPAFQDPCLAPTIGSLLAGSKLGAALEIIAVIDGFEPAFELPSDPRLRYLYLSPNRGLRGAVNAGVAAARGEFLLKCDDHCAFAPGFDAALAGACPSRGVMTALRHALDTEKWAVMPGEPTVYEKLIIHPEDQRFCGVRWRARDRDRAAWRIDETMAMQGSCWVMRRDWWERVAGPLSEEGYGTFAQESTEILFKTWAAGGRLMLNKKTWYAHRHRSFKRTHKVNGKAIRAGNAYALKIWRQFYETEIVPRWFSV